jgi:hypothetical protein
MHIKLVAFLDVTTYIKKYVLAKYKPLQSILYPRIDDIKLECL